MIEICRGQRATLRQAGCLPVRGVGRQQEVLLVTSRYTGEWIAPKGHIDADELAAAAAVREAAEEAGVRGELGPLLGVFAYPRAHRTAEVETYVLEVREELHDWPERGQRRRRWFTIEQALAVVRRPEVRRMLEALQRARLL